MRRTQRYIKKLRLKVTEARSKGHTYEAIRKKYGCSPATISKWSKGIQPYRYCVNCGEINSEKLEQYHPDKTNKPDYIVTLCSNCRLAISSHQFREKIEESKGILKQIQLILPLQAESKSQILPISLNPQITRELSKGALSLAAVSLSVGALLDKEVPFSIRILASLAAVQSFKKAINL
ncbi:MAG: hypothetical protein PHU91_02680 [Candidatus Omnitrophica bacterium]|nr:hypothetical protein [Candidatus Omnitrophota bacterium]MDD5610767.1 hypothetical protein [Candidatus Omnitrophota bacterium]